MSIFIGTTKGKDLRLGRVALAPMSGVTDLPFRRLASTVSKAWVVSEMVACESLAKANVDVIRRAAGGKVLSPFILQLAGCNPYWMSVGAELSQKAGADIIDINMGCPARKVTGGQSGSALMRHEKLAFDIIKATVEATDLVVTLKMRLGWDDSSMNAPIIAQKAQELGVKMITVHGRTRCQFYKGRADWEAVKEICNVVNIPVIVNGDICNYHDAKIALKQSGADGVMIGRAAIGQPWLLDEIDKKLQKKCFYPPSDEKKCELVQAFYTRMLELYGEELGLRVVRKHLSAFVQHHLEDSEYSQKFKSYICQLDDSTQVRKEIDNLYTKSKKDIAA